jgi:8-oxo-dGTP pyrophosphatase MutT (NUDIX family)
MAHASRTPAGAQRFPVPSVRVMVADRAGRVLILRRRPESIGGGAWCLPGGKVDFGQAVEDALARELLEETGLTVVSARFLFYQDSLPTAEAPMHCINLYFACEATGAVRLNHESTEHAWVGEADLAAHELLFGNDEALARYFAERRGAG